MNVETKAKLTFPGGTHPPDSKELTSQIAIAPGPVPKQLKMMLSQHIGAPTRPLVEKGDQVSIGQKIADADAFVCAPVHSPVNGKVKEITLQPHVIMGRSMAIVIDPNPETNTVKVPVNERFDSDFDDNRFSGEQICVTIRKAGLVGMGGAGFPTRVKIEPNPEMPKETMIINGCECEPYLTSDHRLMLEAPEAIVNGMQLAAHAAGIKRSIICIEDNKPDAIEAMRKAAQGRPGIEVAVCVTAYPMGGERQLISAVLGRTVPSAPKGLPLDVGVVVVNVASAHSIARAVVHKLPLTHRVVAVTGGGVSKPGNYLVAVGTMFGELIAHCGGTTQTARRVLAGGPMMGPTVPNLDIPVTKGVGGITVMSEREAAGWKETPCIRCGKCVDYCPLYLSPTKIAHAVKASDYEFANDYNMNACCECGCCSYVCPAHIPITQYIKAGKNRWRTIASQKK